MSLPFIAQELSVSFDGIAVIQSIRLSLEQGNFYALVGRNGAGKSTLIRTLAKREHFSKGTIRLGPWDAANDDGAWGELVAYVSEAVDFRSMKIREIVSIYRKFYPRWDEVKWKRLTELLSLPIETPFISLSRGQRIQIQTALALSQKPDVYLLDEITSVLDARARVVILNELKEETKSGAIVLMATNLVTEIEPVADRMLLLIPGLQPRDLKITELGLHFTRKLLSETEHQKRDQLADGSLWVGTTRKGERVYVSQAMGDPENPPTPEEVFTFLSFLGRSDPR